MMTVILRRKLAGLTRREVNWRSVQIFSIGRSRLAFVSWISSLVVQYCRRERRWVIGCSGCSHQEITPNRTRNGGVMEAHEDHDGDDPGTHARTARAVPETLTPRVAKALQKPRRMHTAIMADGGK